MKNGGNKNVNKQLKLFSTHQPWFPSCHKLADMWVCWTLRMWWWAANLHSQGFGGLRVVRMWIGSGMECIYDVCCDRVRSLPSLKPHTAVCMFFTKYVVMSRRRVLQCYWILTRLFLLLWHTDLTLSIAWLKYKILRIWLFRGALSWVIQPVAWSLYWLCYPRAIEFILVIVIIIQ